MKQVEPKKLRFGKKTIVNLTSVSKLRQGGLAPSADTCKSECNQASCKLDPNCVPRTPSIVPAGSCDCRKPF